MHVSNVGNPCGVLADLQRGLAQDAEAEAVFLVVVDVGPVEVTGVVDEPDGDFAIEFALKNADPDFLAASEMDATRSGKGDVVLCAVNALIEGHDDAHVVAPLFERLA